jgi:tetratricopeptide (TPR) repeat protein
MAVKTDKDLSDNARGLWLKALSAIELRNHGYAISLLQSVLKEAPEFLAARKMLRKAEIAATKGKKGGSSFLGGFSSASLKGSSTVKKDPKAALEMAEKQLESDPYNQSANMLLRDAAAALNMPETAAFALETLVEANPKDTKILHELGEHYTTQGNSDKAVEVYTRISEINPADLIALKRGKDAAAQATLTGGGWEEVSKSGGTKDYRDLMKNKEEAVALEQKSRVVKSDEMIEQQLAELGQQYEQNPQGVDVCRRIAMLYEQKGDLENAVAWYNYTSDLTKNTDPAISRKASDLGLKMLDNKIGEFDQWLEQYSDAENAAEVRQQLDDLKKQKADMLLGEARKRVERNPTDLVFRYELGEQLLASGQPTEAIPELQKARNNPAVRLKAMNLLGQCYTQKGMLDLAVKQFSDAAGEILAMDNTKKEILYKLGLVYEKMGNKEKSLDCMKQIYDVDYGYEDVAKRVEESYGG